MEIDSMPDELDQLKRTIKQLEINKAAILSSGKKTPKLRSINQELSALKEKSTQLELHWNNEKNIISQIRQHKKDIDELKVKAEISQRQGSDLTEVAKIKYSLIPELESKIKSLQEELIKIQKKGQRILKEEVDEEDVAKVVARWTGIPVNKMLADDLQKLANAETELNKEVIGQEDAINAVAKAIRRSRAGINEEKRPIGSFLFIGPTGVGKTELAKALARFLFNDENALIRLDMSEYMEKHSAAKLIGSPPGYIGHDEGGQLTEKVRRHPYSVLLFDEIEKAHPDMFNMLLQILDDGRLTDSKGRVVNFKNTVIIMTSNLGNEVIKQYSIGFSNENETIKKDQARSKEMKEKVDKILKEHFKLEFLNRIDEIVLFKSLQIQDLEKIVNLELKKVENRLNAKNIAMQIGAKVKKFLAAEGYDTTYGARPLKRVIQSLILDELSMQIIENKIQEGDVIKIELSNKDKILITHKDTKNKK